MTPEAVKRRSLESGASIVALRHEATDEGLDCSLTVCLQNNVQIKADTNRA
jgi:hypothetical protein